MISMEITVPEYLPNSSTSDEMKLWRYLNHLLIKVKYIICVPTCISLYLPKFCIGIG